MITATSGTLGNWSLCTGGCYIQRDITGVSRISALGVYTSFGVWQERVFAPNKRPGHLFGERKLGDNIVGLVNMSF